MEVFSLRQFTFVAPAWGNSRVSLKLIAIVADKIVQTCFGTYMKRKSRNSVTNDRSPESSFKKIN